MKRSALILLGLVIPLLGAGALLWVRGRSVSAAIAARAAAGGELDLAEVADFEWDKVYLFGPYTPRQYVGEALGFEWPSLGGSDIESSDGVTLVVFVKDGRVVKSFDHPRHRGDFLPVTPGIGAANSGFTKAQAKFVVRHQDGRPVVYFAGSSATGTTTSAPAAK